MADSPEGSAQQIDPQVTIEHEGTTVVPGTTPTEAPKEQQEVTPSPSVDDRIAALEKDLKEQSNLKTVMGRQGQELGQLRQQNAHYKQMLEQSGTGTEVSPGEPATAPQAVTSDPDQALRSFQTDLLFDNKVDNAKKRYNEVIDYINGPAQVSGELGGYLKSCGLDGTSQLACLHAISKKIDIEEALAIKEKNRKDTAQLETRQSEQKAGAVISGGTAAPVPTTIDLNDPSLTADQLLATGAVPYDPNDPPEAIRSGRVKPGR